MIDSVVVDHVSTPVTEPIQLCGPPSQLVRLIDHQVCNQCLQYQIRGPLKMLLAEQHALVSRPFMLWASSHTKAKKNLVSSLVFGAVRLRELDSVISEWRAKVRVAAGVCAVCAV